MTIETTITGLAAEQLRLADALANEPGDRDRILAECKSLAIGVLRPCVNRSEAENQPEGDHIRLGLLAIRDIGPAVAAAVTAGRSKRDYDSFYDFIDRVDPAVVNRRTLLALIRAGAFDVIGHPRQALADVVAELAEDPAARPALGSEEWDRNELLHHEIRHLGIFVDQHPLDGFDALLKPYRGATIADVLDGSNLINPDGSVRVAGRLDETVRRITKQGRAWMSATLRDRTGTIEVLILPDVYERAGAWIADAALIAFRARISRWEGTTRLEVERVYDPAAEVADLLTGYGPDNYLYSLSDVICREAPGDVLADLVPREPEDSSANAISAVVMRALRVQLAEAMVQAAEAYRADLSSVDDAHIALGVPVQWLPSKFFYSLARKISGVVWPNYTGEQRERLAKYAALMCHQHARRWLMDRDRKPVMTREQRDALPREAWIAISTGTFHSAEHRNRATMLSAFLSTMPAEEIRQADIDDLLGQVNKGVPVERPFF